MLKNAPTGWKVNSVKKAYSSELIEIYEDTLDLEGKEKIYIRGIRKDYSTIVPFVSKDEILVIKSYRHLVDSIQIEVPSGYIDEGETPKEAAIRELREETGYAAKDVVSIGHYTLDYSMFEQKGNLFVAYGIVKEGLQSLGIMEKIDIEIITIKEIKQLLFEGKILNAASIEVTLRFEYYSLIFLFNQNPPCT
ncbi:MAG: pyrophosphohydrolase [Nitrososphaeraceae archaeon]|nr:pyrophosphohydrolase [Nitrososphaeraceae archaeon]